MSDATIRCRKCQQDSAALAKPPFRSELGDRIVAQICASCWQVWLKQQTQIINHYGLDPRDKRAREFLYQQIEQVLFEGGPGSEIDTTKQGSIEW